MEYTWHYPSPLGAILLAGTDRALTGLWFEGQRRFGAGLQTAHEEKRTPVFEETARWLDTYFSGREPDFAPPIQMAGTPFQRRVWEILMTIPYGSTMSYAAIAEILSAQKGSARAVGGAVGRNMISILIPCHRVVGSNGSLTGYAGGIDRKRALLRLEGAALPGL